jgi:hypothetical protein
LRVGPELDLQAFLVDRLQDPGALVVIGFEACPDDGVSLVYERDLHHYSRAILKARCREASKPGSAAVATSVGIPFCGEEALRWKTHGCLKKRIEMKWDQGRSNYGPLKDSAQADWELEAPTHQRVPVQVESHAEESEWLRAD